MLTLETLLNDPSIIGCDFEFIDKNGIMFRGPIKAVDESPDRTSVNFALQWCARIILDAGGTWYATYDKNGVSVEKKRTSLIDMGGEGIDFEIEGELMGTIYPRDRGLDPKEVIGFTNYI